jgi:hypothetical protein
VRLKPLVELEDIPEPEIPAGASLAAENPLLG